MAIQKPKDFIRERIVYGHKITLPICPPKDKIANYNLPQKEQRFIRQPLPPEPKIYWSFIESERNRFLKNYKHGISRSITVPAVTEGYLVTVDCGNSRGGEFASGSKLESFISDGHYAGCYEKDVAWQAYDWWAAYLDEVDKLASIYDTG